MGAPPARQLPGQRIGAAFACGAVAATVLLLGHAFELWMVRCLAAAGVPDLSPLDVLVAHTIAHRAKPKRLADICLVLSIEDTHLVTYSVKKLDAIGLIVSGRSGNEKTVTLNKKGENIIRSYTRLREQLLVAPVKSAGSDERRLARGVAPAYVAVGLCYAGLAVSPSIWFAALAIVDPVSVAISVIGAVALNLVVAINHKPGRYLGV